MKLWDTKEIDGAVGTCSGLTRTTRYSQLTTQHITANHSNQLTPHLWRHHVVTHYLIGSRTVAATNQHALNVMWLSTSLITAVDTKLDITLLCSMYNYEWRFITTSCHCLILIICVVIDVPNSRCQLDEILTPSHHSQYCILPSAPDCL